jgi:hypothetical protein
MKRLPPGNTPHRIVLGLFATLLLTTGDALCERLTLDVQPAASRLATLGDSGLSGLQTVQPVGANAPNFTNYDPGAGAGELFASLHTHYINETNPEGLAAGLFPEGPVAFPALDSIPSSAPAPEPSSLMLLGTGVILFALFAKWPEPTSLTGRDSA